MTYRSGKLRVQANPSSHLPTAFCPRGGSEGPWQGNEPWLLAEEEGAEAPRPSSPKASALPTPFMLSALDLPLEAVLSYKATCSLRLPTWAELRGHVCSEAQWAESQWAARCSQGFGNVEKT